MGLRFACVAPTATMTSEAVAVCSCSDSRTAEKLSMSRETAASTTEIPVSGLMLGRRSSCPGRSGATGMIELAEPKLRLWRNRIVVGALEELATPSCFRPSDRAVTTGKLAAPTAGCRPSKSSPSGGIWTAQSGAGSSTMMKDPAVPARPGSRRTLRETSAPREGTPSGGTVNATAPVASRAAIRCRAYSTPSGIATRLSWR